MTEKRHSALRSGDKKSGRAGETRSLFGKKDTRRFRKLKMPFGITMVIFYHYEALVVVKIRYQSASKW
ncbi:MAG: hypothetical protein Q4A06_05925 [Cardiobacteriaceae bacterium]|nr:hypothetical protein [Cardiobacteriaceae bacterium]